MRRFVPITQLRRFLPAREGATAIEYALVACGISIAILGAVSNLGTQIMVIFYDKLNNLF